MLLASTLKTTKSPLKWIYLAKYSLALTGALFECWYSLYWRLQMAKIIFCICVIIEGSCFYDIINTGLFIFLPSQGDSVKYVKYETIICHQEQVYNIWNWCPTEKNHCQNFSLGHNFCHRTFDCCKKRKNWSIQIICQFSMSPKICLFHLEILPDGKETSAKISVLVTIFVIKPFIIAK